MPTGEKNFSSDFQMMRHTSFSIKSLTIGFLLFLSAAVFGQKAYTIAEIPDPKKNGGGWVSDPDHILSPTDIAQVNSTISEFESKTNVQVAVIIVNNFDQNQEDFDFAFELFNTWGIGSKTANNGLLLFIAKDRRKYRFITGTGVEGVLPDVKLKHIAEQNLLPAFRENNFGTGIINTIDAIGIIILNPENKSELNQFFTQSDGKSTVNDFWIPMVVVLAAFSGCIFFLRKKRSIITKTQKKESLFSDFGCGSIMILSILIGFAFIFIGFGTLSGIFNIKTTPYLIYAILSLIVLANYHSTFGKLKKIYRDPKNLSDAIVKFIRSTWWIVLFSPLILIGIISKIRAQKKIAARFIPLLDSNKEEMTRIDRDENPSGKPYLSEGQQKEEKVESIMYDIWKGNSGETKLVPNDGENRHKFEVCPGCSFNTLTTPFTKTILSATYARSGKGKEMQECKNCNFEVFIREVSLPKLVKSTSSSSSSSSGSSSSSSSSSSWGGGRSSGGGTGGSW